MFQIHEQSIYTTDFPIKIEKEFAKSARARDIYVRSRLDSSDGKVLDDHDQFYRDHKLLLLLFRVLGVMPVQRGQIGRITFGWCSSAMIYAYFFYAVTTILVLIVGYERILILTTKSKKFDEYIYSIIFIIYLVPHFFIPIMGWSVAREVCDYKNSWTHFQLSFYKVTGKSLEFPHLNTLIVTISAGCLMLAVVFLLTLSALLEGFTLYHTTGYLHIITMINMNCALWYINCRAIGNASNALSDNFEEDLQDYCPAYIIKYYRILWLSLSDIFQKLGNAYARTYCIYSLLMITNITIAVYGFISEIVDHGFQFTFKEIGLLIDSGYCSVLFYIYCHFSDRTSNIIASKVQHKLLDLKIAEVETDARKEIELFLIAIKMNPPKISLRGYAIVNRELFTSSVATISIYLIVLLQFKISLVRDQKLW